MSTLLNERRIPVVMGPTASGKSALALELAERIGGEIISVDSMQLYKGLEIGTAQPSAEEKRRVPHHLVGEFDFHHRVDVFQFQRLADEAIADCFRRGKTPVLAGGTGMYLRALLYGIDDLPADRELRARLDAEYDRPEALDALRQQMQQLDPAGLERWHDCRRRLIRALEVRLITGKSILELQQNPGDQLRYKIRAFKLETPPEILRKRIFDRAAQMLQTGWIEETTRAIADGLLTSPTAHQALGYRLIAAHLAGEFNLKELLEKIGTATWQLARRQRTWFRHQHPEAEVLTMPCTHLPF